MVNPWTIDPYLSSGVVLGLFIDLVYIVATLRNRGEVHFSAAVGLLLDRDLGVCLGLILAACGIAAGVKLCVLSMLTTVLVEILGTTERLYVFGGGFAVIWISVRSIYRVFFRAAPDAMG
jgi:hypothetical protein